MISPTPSIDTQAPTLANISFDPKHGVFVLTFQDNVGLNLASLLNAADYSIHQGNKAATHPTVVANITPAGSGPQGRHSSAARAGLLAERVRRLARVQYVGELEVGAETPFATR